MIHRTAVVKKGGAGGVGLVLLGIASLCMTTGINRAAGQAIHAAGLPIGGVATAAIPSFLVVAAAYMLLSDRRSVTARPVAGSRGPVRYWAVNWLFGWYLCAALACIASGTWIVYARGPAAIAAFLLFGALGEELLFRGILYERAETWRRGSGIAVSSILFALHHFELHDGLSWFAVGHVAIALPLGIVLGRIRRFSGSIWPGFVVHLATNIPFIALG